MTHARWREPIRIAALIGLAIGLSLVCAAQTLRRHPPPSTAYIAGVNRALRSKIDLWGEQLLHAPHGPTLAAARQYLHPLWHQFRWYSESEVYYLPFGMEDSLKGGADFALHYADGSAIVTRRAELPPARIPKAAPASAGQRITFFVGPHGQGRYGSNLERLATPRLGGGYLPILITSYRDAAGDQYREESFAVRIRPARSLVSFIHFTVVASPGGPGTELRIHFSRVNRKAKKVQPVRGLSARDGRILGPDGAVYLLYSPGARLRGADLIYRAAAGRRSQIWLVRLNNPGPISPLKADRDVYMKARRRLTQYWNRKLDAGAEFIVPERYALDAEKNLLIQNLLMNVRYSIGNPYETTFNSESHFSIQALGDYGFLPEYAAGLGVMLSHGHPGQYEMGERLLHGANYYFLTRNVGFLARHDAAYKAYVAALQAEIARNHGLLQRVPTGTDIAGPSAHFNMHMQAVAWRGLRDMAEAWRLSGDPAEAGRAAAAAATLGHALRQAIRASSTWLPDGSLFVPVHLLEPTKVRPFDPITATKQGAYWLLVATDGFATGILNRRQDAGVLRYLYDHGANLLGMIRFNYTGVPVGGCNPNGLPGYAVPGVDNAYLPSYIEFLSANDQAGRLVLSFYGKLAQGMTQNTFVAGEGGSIGVCQAAHPADMKPDLYYRTMYLPPNSTNNASYLLALRQMLIRAPVDSQGKPAELDLAFATPRSWLANGKAIAVRHAPTAFGRLNYTITSHVARNVVDASIDVPSRNPIPTLRLRLRAPGDRRLLAVKVNRRPYKKFTAAGDIDLTGQHGALRIRARFSPAA